MSAIAFPMVVYQPRPTTEAFLASQCQRFHEILFEKSMRLILNPTLTLRLDQVAISINQLATFQSKSVTSSGNINFLYSVPIENLKASKIAFETALETILLRSLSLPIVPPSKQSLISRLQAKLDLGFTIAPEYRDALNYEMKDTDGMEKRLARKTVPVKDITGGVKRVAELFDELYSGVALSASLSHSSPDIKLHNNGGDIKRYNNCGDICSSDDNLEFDFAEEVD